MKPGDPIFVAPTAPYAKAILHQPAVVPAIVWRRGQTFVASVGAHTQPILLVPDTEGILWCKPEHVAAFRTAVSL